MVSFPAFAAAGWRLPASFMAFQFHLRTPLAVSWNESPWGDKALCLHNERGNFSKPTASSYLDFGVPIPFSRREGVYHTSRSAVNGLNKEKRKREQRKNYYEYVKRNSQKSYAEVS